MIEQLRTELQTSTERIAKPQPVAGEAPDAAARIAHLEALLAEYRETIAAQEQTIENLAADNSLLAYFSAPAARAPSSAAFAPSRSA